MDNTLNIIEFLDQKTSPDLYHNYNDDLVKRKPILIIDNGSYKCRAGWNIYAEPLLEFRNLIAKPRKDRKKETADISTPSIQIGNLVNINMQLKTQFDRNIVTHFYNQEQIFDYMFSHLSINTDGNISHPILLTEALGNPNHCRHQMNELLFELYDIPAVVYCNDALISWHYNQRKTEDGLILSFGYHTTHVIPILNGLPRLQHARRLNIGGYHITSFFYRLMQMKYPSINAITISRMETLIHNHGFIATDYLKELQNWEDQNYYSKHIKKIQLPFVNQTQNCNQVNEQKSDRRKEMAQRLIEINIKRAKEKQLKDEEKLEFYCQIRQLYVEGEEDNFRTALTDCGFDTLADLNKNITLLHGRLERLKQRTLNQNFPKDKNSLAIKPPENITLQSWILDINKKRDALFKKRQARKLRRQELSKRHTIAAQERMRIISALARNEKGQDEFGKNEDDWNVYKVINRDNDTDSETENEKIIEYESILRQYDPQFEKQKFEHEFIAEKYQLHVGVEFFRSPEIIFQPSMIGKGDMGIIELIDFVLAQFVPSEQQRMVNSIFIVGGAAKFPGLQERLKEEIRKIRPFGTEFDIFKAESFDLGAWYSAKEFSLSKEFTNLLLTKTEYEENGPGFLKTHHSSNFFYPTPKTY